MRILYRKLTGTAALAIHDDRSLTVLACSGTSEPSVRMVPSQALVFFRAKALQKYLYMEINRKLKFPINYPAFLSATAFTVRTSLDGMSLERRQDFLQVRSLQT